MEIELRVFLVLSLCRSKLLTSRSVRFVSERTAIGVHWIGKWVDPRAGLRVVSKLTFRHRASCILGQAFRYSPENAFYIFNQQIYFII